MTHPLPALLPLLIEPEDLHSIIDNPRLLIIDLSSDAHYLDGHIKGAIFLPFKALMAGTPPAPGKLPDITHLEHVFSQLGLTPETHIVAYDDEGGGWAGRLIWTLDVIGHTQYSYLNGGREAWAESGFDFETTLNAPTATQYTVNIDRTPIAEIDDILPHIENDSITVWDARSPAEYKGEKVLAQKGGHIPGAINIEWTDLMDKENQRRIRSDAKEYLASKGITGDKPIITHCQSHHRSAFTYLVGKVLGMSIRGYHGSWSEWGNHPNTPTEK